MIPALPGVPRGARLAVVCLATGLLTTVACFQARPIPPSVAVDPPPEHPAAQGTIEEIVRALDPEAEPPVPVDELVRLHDTWTEVVAPLEPEILARLSLEELATRMDVGRLILELPSTPETGRILTWISEVGHLAGNFGLEARARGQACRVWLDLDRFDTAREACAHALAIADADTDAELTAGWKVFLHFHLVRSFREASDGVGLRQSVRGLRQVLEDYSNNTAPLYAEAFTELGHAWFILGEYKLAEDGYERAIQIYERLESRGEPINPAHYASGLHGLGNVYNRLAEHENALELYRRALEQYDAAGADEGVAGSWRAIGQVLQKRGEVDLARAAFESALDTAEAIEPTAPGRLEQVADGLRFLGDFLLEVGEPAEALSRFLEAEATYRELGRVGEWADSSVGIASASLELGDVETAHRYLDRAERINVNNQRREELAETHHVRARTYLASNELELASEESSQALEKFREVRASAGDSEDRAGLSDSLRRYHELHVQIYMTRHAREPDRGWDALGLKASEEARAQSLLEDLQLARMTLASEDLRERLKTVQARLGQIDMEIASQAATNAPFVDDVLFARSPQLSDLTFRRDELANELESLNAELEAVNPGLDDPEAVSVGEIRRVLDDDTTFLEYFLGEHHSYLWIVTRDSDHALELTSPRSEIESAVQELYEAHEPYARVQWPEGTPTSEIYDAMDAADERFALASEKLSEILLEPVRELGGLDRRRLVIVGDGALQYLPFAALPDPSAPGYLVERHDIVRLDSASVLHMQRRPAPSGDRPDRELMLVSPASRGTSSKLFYAEKEAEAITSLYPDPDDVVSLLEDEATLANVKAADPGRFRIVHFATHGVVDSTDSSRSYLELSGASESSRLTLVDVYALELENTELVVLSACSTALGRELRGEGLISLARGFTYAGADTIVATLWQVKDIYTADLMEKFYRGMLERDLEPSAALAAAQREYLREHDTPPPPYYWAGFTLQGDWQ